MASSISAPSKTTAASLPPSSKNTGFIFLLAALYTFLPVVVLPVKHIKSHCSIKAAPTLPSPSKYLKIFFRIGTSLIIASITFTNLGVTSLGFTITAQPASNAGIVSINDNNKGKFQGLITPTN